MFVSWNTEAREFLVSVSAHFYVVIDIRSAKFDIIARERVPERV